MYKKSCTFLREHATNVTNFEKKKMLLITKEELKSHQDPKAWHICGNSFLNGFLMIKIIGKLEIVAIIQVNIEAQHIVYEI